MFNTSIKIRNWMCRITLSFGSSLSQIHLTVCDMNYNLHSIYIIYHNIYVCVSFCFVGIYKTNQLRFGCFIFRCIQVTSVGWSAIFFFTKKRRLNFFTKLVSVKQMSHILEKNTRKKNRKTISEQIPNRTYSIFIDNLRKNTFRSYWLTYIDIDQYRYSFFINYHLFSYASDAHDYQIFIQKTFELTCVDLVAWSHRSNV